MEAIGEDDIGLTGLRNGKRMEWWETAGLQYEKEGGESGLEGGKRRRQSRMGHLLVGGEDENGEA